MFSVVYMVLVSLINCRFCFSALSDDGTIVVISDGTIQGHILTSESGSDYYAFQEVPYAASTEGTNRLKLPQDPLPWDGVLSTVQNTKVCYQLPDFITDSTLVNSEDCLYLNVYTPVVPGTVHNLPVLVWIHGGSFISGDGTYNIFGPKYLMDYGVVVVTMNYRLGTFGFLTTEDDVIPGNLGLKDQQFALRWVQKNIGAFGGNSSHVVIAGQDAGSTAVGLHLMGQGNETLFHAAIMQSGSPLSFINNQYNATQNAFDIGRALDSSFASDSSQDLLNLMQSASADDIIAMVGNLSTGVVIEETGDFSHPPLQTFMNGEFKKIPLLVGFTSEEMGLLAEDEDTLLDQVILDVFPDTIVDYDSIRMTDANRTTAGYSIRSLYTNDSSFTASLAGYVRWISDSWYSIPVCKQVELSATLARTYLYQFSYKGKLGNATTVDYQAMGKVLHAEDLQYMWDTGSNTDLSKFSEADQQALHRHVKWWTNFIKYFNPTPEADPLLQNVMWYTANTENLRYLNIDARLEFRDHPRQYYEVKKIIDAYIEPPYISY